eukprot:7843876-Lingulodinium_polyedra.AAC.1
MMTFLCNTPTSEWMPSRLRKGWIHPAACHLPRWPWGLLLRQAGRGAVAAGHLLFAHVANGTAVLA